MPRRKSESGHSLFNSLLEPWKPVAAITPDPRAHGAVHRKHDFKDPYNHSPLIHQQWMTLHILYQYRDWLHELQRQGKDPRKESIHEHIHDEM